MCQPLEGAEHPERSTDILEIELFGRHQVSARVEDVVGAKFSRRRLAARDVQLFSFLGEGTVDSLHESTTTDRDMCAGAHGRDVST